MNTNDAKKGIKGSTSTRITVRGERNFENFGVLIERVKRNEYRSDKMEERGEKKRQILGGRAQLSSHNERGVFEQFKAELRRH